MKIFVTGIAGFLGSAIAREALRMGWEVTGVDNLLGGDKSNVPTGVNWKETDCVTPDAYTRFLSDVDVVYHCAAAPYEGLSVFSPQVVYQNTLMSTIGVLRAAVTAKVTRFVFCSSMSRYGGQEPPFTENMVPQPVDPYAHAKVASENIVKNLCDLYGVEWVIAVPHNIYGPGQRYYDPFRNVAGIMINRILLGKSPIVYGDGKQIRCFSYIDDVTGPLLQLATRDDIAGHVFNVGPGPEESIHILGLAHLIRFLLGCGPNECLPEFFPARPAEVHHAVCSAEKAKTVLGYKPRVELDRGIDKYIDWVKSQGARPFEYHLPIEIITDETPKTWTEQLM